MPRRDSSALPPVMPPRSAGRCPDVGEHRDRNGFVDDQAHVEGRAITASGRSVVDVGAVTGHRLRVERVRTRVEQLPLDVESDVEVRLPDWTSEDARRSAVRLPGCLPGPPGDQVEFSQVADERATPAGRVRDQQQGGAGVAQPEPTDEAGPDGGIVDPDGGEAVDGGANALTIVGTGILGLGRQGEQQRDQWQHGWSRVGCSLVVPSTCMLPNITSMTSDDRPGREYVRPVPMNGLRSFKIRFTRKESIPGSRVRV